MQGRNHESNSKVGGPNRAKPDSRAQNARDLRAKSELRAKPDKERARCLGEVSVSPSPDFVWSFELRIVQSGVYLIGISWNNPLYCNVIELNRPPCKKLSKLGVSLKMLGVLTTPTPPPPQWLRPCIHAWHVFHNFENTYYIAKLWHSESARTWDRTGCEFESWQCQIYISHVHRAYDCSGLLGFSWYIWLATKYL